MSAMDSIQIILFLSLLRFQALYSLPERYLMSSDVYPCFRKGWSKSTQHFNKQIQEVSFSCVCISLQFVPKSHWQVTFQRHQFFHSLHSGESYPVAVATLDVQDNHCSLADLHTPVSRSFWHTIMHFFLHGPQPSHWHFAIKQMDTHTNKVVTMYKY